MVFLSQLVPGQAIYWVGLIPLLVGVVLLVFSELMMPSD
jgi:cadmium resistance protein CadD (predicted permease)